MRNEGASKIVGMRDIWLETSVGYKLLLKDVRHVPDIRLNLISTRKLDDDGYTNQFGEGKWKLTKGFLVLAKEKKMSTLYVIEAKIKKKDVNVTVKDPDIETWNKRLGHIGEKGLETLGRKGFLPSFAGTSLNTCVHCLVGKAHRVAFKSFSPSRKNQILDLIHTDVCMMQSRSI